MAGRGKFLQSVLEPPNPSVYPPCLSPPQPSIRQMTSFICGTETFQGVFEIIDLFLFILNEPPPANISFGQICCALVGVKGGVLCVPSRVNACPKTKEGPEGRHYQATGQHAGRGRD